MALDLTALRRMVWKPIGMESDDTPGQLTRDEIDLYLNRAFWEVQDKFPFREKEITVFFDTVAGVRSYDIPEPVEALRGVYIEELESKVHRPLHQITTNTYEGAEPNDPHYTNDEEEWGFPEKYVRENCFIRLWPTPDKAYVIILKRLKILADLSNNNATPAIPQVWHEIIGMGGLWRCYYDFGDFTRAEYIKNTQRQLISDIEPVESKEKQANTTMSALQVIRNEYP